METTSSFSSITSISSDLSSLANRSMPATSVTPPKNEEGATLQATPSHEQLRQLSAP